ncbi:MAG: DNA-binding protein [Parashewanella sp.]
MSHIAIQIASPFVTVDEYSRMSGIPKRTLDTMIGDGRIPIRPKNKAKEKPLINVLALMKEAADLSPAA